MDTYDEYNRYLDDLEKYDERYHDGDMDEEEIKDIKAKENITRQKMFFTKPKPKIVIEEDEIEM